MRLDPVPASLAACGRRGSAATSPHVAQPMGGSCSGQSNAGAGRVTPSHFHSSSAAAAAYVAYCLRGERMECLTKADVLVL